MVLTGDDLRNFAAQKGLLIHPVKDPDEWAKLINSNSGKCNCAPDRTCPCDLAVAEVLESSNPKEQRCACTFFVSPEYLTEFGYDKKGKLARSKAVAKKAETALMRAPEKALVPVSEASKKIGEIVTKIKEAKASIDKEAYDDSVETLAIAVEESGCDVCEKLLVPEMVHVEYVRGLCGVDKEACTKETRALQERFDRIISYYEKAQEMEVNDAPETPEAEPEAAKAEPVKESSDYHQCLREMLKSEELAAYEKSLKFYIASKVCSGKAASIEDAITMATSDHPEWFQ